MESHHFFVVISPFPYDKHTTYCYLYLFLFFIVTQDMGARDLNDTKNFNVHIFQ